MHKEGVWKWLHSSHKPWWPIDNTHYRPVQQRRTGLHRDAFVFREEIKDLPSEEIYIKKVMGSHKYVLVGFGEACLGLDSKSINSMKMKCKD